MFYYFPKNIGAKSYGKICYRSGRLLESLLFTEMGVDLY